MNARNLAEIVESSPGVRISTECGNCNQQQIQMLGLSQNYVSILSDGLPNFSSLAGVYGIEQIPAGLVGGIEIVKGGGSVLYGANAVAGVINLLPRDPEKTGTEVSFQLGGYTNGDSFGKEPNYSAFLLQDFVNSDESLKITMFYNRDYVAPNDMNGDGFTNISKRLLDAGGLRVAWRPSNEHLLSFDYFISDEERRGGDAGDAFDDKANTNKIAEEIFSTRHVGTVKWEGSISEKWKGTLAYSYSQTDRDSYYGGTAALNPGGTDTGQAGYGTSENGLHFVNALTYYELNDRHRFTLGVQYQREHLTDTYIAADRAIDELYTDAGYLCRKGGGRPFNS